ncbi:MAG: acetolactate synthase large subunit, partial [Scytonema sp. CRU_2_7]|nr:acetolactate synthase large subunit [Scytonema sp. CRU_2_7]
MRPRSVSVGESPSQISLPQTENQSISNISLSPVVTPRRASGGFALLDSLQRHGVEYIFGYPGGAILPIYDDLYKVEAAGG